jgi:metal transporter CNNM
MPPESLVLTVIVLLFFSAICSGLNVALISLDPNELKRKSKLGDKRAKRVYPLRKNAHLSLASILLANVAFASGMAIVLGNSLNGFIAGGISTLLLVVFGELLPQALFTKDALKFCAIFAPSIRLATLLTYPISKPLQKVLDKWFGPHGQKTLHSRHELGLLIDEHIDEPKSELDDDEVEIIRGALQLSEKQVTDIMTPINSVFWLKHTDNIDAHTIDKIKNAGKSRIPIFSKNLETCFGVLLVKELVDIDFDNETIPVSKARLHKTKSIGGKTALDTMFRHFIAARTHLMPVVQNGKIVGIVTIEDLIEEIIGHEIVDESDVAKA